jgi:membrane-associated protein
MEALTDFLRFFNDPQHIIEAGGLVLLILIIFVENGLIIGLFFPGDSLLFIAGIFVAAQPSMLSVELSTLQIALILASILGNGTGYWFGGRWGKKLYQRPDGFLFKRKYLEATEKYYEKNGGKTLIIGKFLPYIRTLAPIIAGVIQVPLLKFWLYNIIGSLLWVLSLTFLGYFLGIQFPWIRNYVEWIAVLFIIVASWAVFRTYRKTQKES